MVVLANPGNMMSLLVAMAYDDPLKARDTRLALIKWHGEYLADVDDAIVVSNRWGSIKLRQLVSLSATGEGSGVLDENEIDNRFTTELAKDLKRDSSVLLVLVPEASAQEFVQAVKQYGGTLRKIPLTPEQQSRLRDRIAQAKQDASRVFVNSLLMG